MNYLRLHEKLGKQQIKFMHGQLEVEIDGIRKPIELKFEYNIPYFKVKEEVGSDEKEALERLFNVLSKNEGDICRDFGCDECPFALYSCPQLELKDYYEKYMR